MKSFLSFIILGLSISALLSCNVYAPFNSNHSDLDKLEEAQKCLKSSDFECAIKQYEKLGDSKLKTQKLCQVYLTKGGITLKVLNDTINKTGGTMISKLALELMPFDIDKFSDFDLAKTNCENFAAANPSDGLGVLLKTIAEFSHCAIRMAKTHTFQGTSDADTACNQPPNNLAPNLVREDITPNNLGGYPGMCYSDAVACYNDLKAVSYSVLTDAGYENLSGAMKVLQDQLPGSADATAMRSVLYGTFSP